MESTLIPVEPGSREPAPPSLQLIQEFVNTNDIEAERDDLRTPEQLLDWLASRGYLGHDARISPSQHARAIAVREGLRALGRANNEEPLDRAAVEALNRAAADLPLAAAVHSPDQWHLAPVGGGVDGFLGEVVARLVSAIADGSWSRMKACRNDTCRWLFYDHSRNRSGTWCTMAICGSRLKARAYRARKRGSTRALA